jgi:hypothetical protein
MAVYIAPIVAAVQGILTEDMPALLESTGYGPFLDIGTVFTGVMDNPPEAWVMGMRTQIDDEGNTYYERHLVTVKFGVTATDPDDLASAAAAYMKAITDAVNGASPSDWTEAGAPVPNAAHVVEHDYGPVFQKGEVLARFPECHIEIEVNER